MADERNLGIARALEIANEETSKAELQRRIEETRESISQTVTEIKDTVANQYQQVKESVTEALDWREQFRKRPIAFSVGALSVGLITGYSIAGAIIGDSDERVYETETEDASGSREARPGILPVSARMYAAPPITGTHEHGVESDARDHASSTAGDSERREEEEPEGPGLLERFKGTAAYDRLQAEVAGLGDRVIDELSRTAQTIVLPALFMKIKDYLGMDLSDKSGGGAGSQKATARGPAEPSASGNDRSQRSSGSSGAAPGGDGGRNAASYGTSENRPYGSSPRDRQGTGSGT